MRGSGASARVRLPGGSRLRRVLLAYGLSRFTEFAGWLAILLVAYEHGGANLAGLAAFAMQSPSIVLVPLLAGGADRMPRSRALTLSYTAVTVGAAAVAGLLFIGAPLWAVLVAGAGTTTAVCLVRPMHFASLPLLAKGPGDLVSANGWSSYLDGIAIFTGFTLAGVISESLGAWVVLALCALLGGIAVLLTRGLVLPVVRISDGDAPSEMKSALAGVATLRRRRGALALLLLMAGTSVLMGSNETLAVAFNDHVLHRPESTAGLVAGAYGIGLALGGLTLTGLAQRRALAPVVLAGALLLGLAELSVSFLGALAPVVIMMTLVGVGMAMVVVSARTLLQRSTEDHLLARVLSVQEGVHLTGLTIGYLAGPLVILLVGARFAFVPMGAMVVVIGLLSFASIRALDARSVVHQREVALLSRLPFLAGLPPYELERLAQGSRWADFPAGAVVVRQGDPGDSYYLVASGELSVAVDGVLRTHVLSPGHGFGEISLLNMVPRTATVKALVDSRLLVVSSADFLAAVTSTPDGEGQAREISRARLDLDRQAR